MKKSNAILLVTVAAILLAAGLKSPYSSAQNKGQKGYLMAYYVDVQGDTIFYDELPPVWCFPKGTRRDRKDWRNYYKLVYNFNKVYPYAIMVSNVLNHVDSTIEASHFKKAEENRYTSEWQKQVLKDFEPIIRKMTVSQGQLLMRLVDRETSRTSYKIVKDYRSSVSAVFWQGVARLFGQNLKSAYDPKGQDAQTEELVKAWEAGEFDRLYYSVFMEWPTPTKIPSKYQY
ncbi:MAG: DUF4294 domain-containing protein [Bacteroidales bacterium]|nr:DUF4294 domain-containing protein [Bacteroidales bacterium]